MSEGTGGRADPPPDRSLRRLLARRSATPFIGVFDMLSAAVAARYTEGLFVSGFGFSAVRYGLPDVGVASWGDLVDLVRRLRLHFPRHHLVVDVDDGFGDAVVAARVAVELAAVGASGIVLEDQARPRGYGQLPGRRVLPVDEYAFRLTAVLDATAPDLVVVARTDAADSAEALLRARHYAALGADALLVKRIPDRPGLERLIVGTGAATPLVVDQVPGGGLVGLTRSELAELGVSLVLHSTAAIEGVFEGLHEAAARACVERTTDVPPGHHGRAGSQGLAADVPSAILDLLAPHLLAPHLRKPGAARSH